jgi:uncharacterized membrane protein
MNRKSVLQSKAPLALLILIFVINLLLKLIHISDPSLWYDEIVSVNDTLLDFGHIKHEAEWDKNPPFYHYVLWLWSKLFGISELAVRSMSAFFSSLAAVGIYLFCKKIAGQTRAILCVLLFTFHPYLFYYSQEARCFSFLIFLVICNLYVTVALINKPSVWLALLLGIINFLIVYTHYIAGLLLICQFGLLIFELRARIKLLLITYLTPILLVLIRFTPKQYDVIFFSNEMSRKKANVAISSLKDLWTALNNLYVSYFFFFVFLLVCGGLIFKNMRNNTEKINQQGRLKLYIMLAPLVSVFSLFLIGKLTNVFDSRYLLFISPFILISIVITPVNRVFLNLYVALILIFEIPQLKFGASKGMDYKFAAYLAQELHKRDDAVILLQTHDIVSLFTYYYDFDLYKKCRGKLDDDLKKHNIYFIDNRGELSSLEFDKKKPIIFFQTYQNPFDSDEIMKYFKSNGYKRFSSNQIEGIKFSYLAEKND